MECADKSERKIITGRLTHAGSSHGPVRRAEVRLSVQVAAEEGAEPQFEQVDKTLTDVDGKFRFSRKLDRDATYRVEAEAFKLPPVVQVVSPGGPTHVDLVLPLKLEITTFTSPDEGVERKPTDRARVGRRIVVRLETGTEPGAAAKRTTAAKRSDVREHIERFEIVGGWGGTAMPLEDHEAELVFGKSGVACIEALVRDRNRNNLGDYAEAVVRKEIPVSEPDVNVVSGRLGVALDRAAVAHTPDQALWVAIRNRTRAISFGPYRDFIDNRVLHVEDREPTGIAPLDRRLQDLDLGANLHGVNAYQLLKTATEAFLLLECGVRISQDRFERHRLFNREEESERLRESVNADFVSAKLREYLGSPPQLPYITRVVDQLFRDLVNEGDACDRVLTARINEPCLIELIWSYWHEEGMLAQSMNAINRRFQNIKAPGSRDPLAHFELDPLRRVGNLLWGQIQDEVNQLSVRRRAYEYLHQYGLSLYGKAAGGMRPADNRSKFLEAFHNLLHLTSIFYKEDNDTTVIADGFPLLNALKEVHLILAQGAHNQFGDLPWTARAEMMVQEYILSRPEIREFLQSRHMVPYKEAWMPQVDTMKSLQGWSDVTVTHFRDLGVYGEQILLSIRYGDWIDVALEDSAKNWARYWRPEIQGYLHAYRAVTGVDLTNPDTVDATVPAFHLQKRLDLQQRAR